MKNIVIVLQIFRRFIYRHTNFWKFMDERNKLRLNYVIPIKIFEIISFSDDR